MPFVQKQCIIDTAYLYSYEGVPFKSVGLKLVMNYVLNAEVQKGDHGHSSVEDAISALRLVLDAVEALKECRPRTATIPLELAPWYSTLLVFSILESHRDEACIFAANSEKYVEFYKKIRMIMTLKAKGGLFLKKTGSHLLKWIMPWQKGGQGNRYYMNTLPSSAVALEFGNGWVRGWKNPYYFRC